MSEIVPVDPEERPAPLDELRGLAIHGVAVVLVVFGAACSGACARGGGGGSASGSGPTKVEPTASAPSEDAKLSVVVAVGDARAAAPLPITSAASSQGASWVDAPFDGLPEATRTGRDVSVVFEVAAEHRRELGGLSSVLRLRIPDTKVAQELFDDHVSRPACQERQDASRGAVFLRCSGADGAVSARAYQDGEDLVLDVVGNGDVRPTIEGQRRFKLPHGTRVRYVMRLTTTLGPNPSNPGPK